LFGSVIEIKLEQPKKALYPISTRLLGRDRVIRTHPPPNNENASTNDKNKKGIFKIIVELERKRKWHATAYNGRFCGMAALPPQTILCVIARLSPAGTSVKPPLRQAAGRNMKAGV